MTKFVDLYICRHVFSPLHSTYQLLRKAETFQLYQPTVLYAFSLHCLANDENHMDLFEAEFTSTAQESKDADRSGTCSALAEVSQQLLVQRQR